MYYGSNYFLLELSYFEKGDNIQYTVPSQRTVSIHFGIIKALTMVMG